MQPATRQDSRFPGTLPPLRDELALSPGPPEAEGAPTFILHDPVRNRFFRLS